MSDKILPPKRDTNEQKKLQGQTITDTHSHAALGSQVEKCRQRFYRIHGGGEKTAHNLHDGASLPQTTETRDGITRKQKDKVSQGLSEKVDDDNQELGKRKRRSIEGEPVLDNRVRKKRKALKELPTNVPFKAAQRQQERVQELKPGAEEGSEKARGRLSRGDTSPENSIQQRIEKCKQEVREEYPNSFLRVDTILHQICHQTPRNQRLEASTRDTFEFGIWQYVLEHGGGLPGKIMLDSGTGRQGGSSEAQLRWSERRTRERWTRMRQEAEVLEIQEEEGISAQGFASQIQMAVRERGITREELADLVQQQQQRQQQHAAAVAYWQSQGQQDLQQAQQQQGQQNMEVLQQHLLQQQNTDRMQQLQQAQQVRDTQLRQLQQVLLGQPPPPSSSGS